MKLSLIEQIDMTRHGSADMGAKFQVMSIKVTSSILFWCLQLWLFFCTLETVDSPVDPRKNWLGVNSGLPWSAWEMLNQPSASFPHLASLPASTACVSVLVWVLTVSVCPCVCIFVGMFLCIQVCLCAHYVPCPISPQGSLAGFDHMLLYLVS